MNDVAKLEDIIHEGSTYYIEGCMLVPNNLKYCGTMHDYAIILTKWVEITPTNDDNSIPLDGFRFIDFQEIPRQVQNTDYLTSNCYVQTNGQPQIHPNSNIYMQMLSAR